jgi:hypothetical protein
MSMVTYDLACFAFQQGHIAFARQWFERAVAFGDEENVKLLALADPEMAPLWDGI